MALQTWAVVSHARHDDAGGPVRVESRRPTPPTEEASCIRIRLIFPASPFPPRYGAWNMEAPTLRTSGS
jgi:hypothetical protein